MIRQAISADSAAIEGFLATQPETSMFLRGNLAQFGIGSSCAPHASTYWIDVEAADVRGVFGKSNNGYMMVQAPDATPAFWAEVAKLLVGAEVRGMTGVPWQVDAALASFGLALGDFLVNKDEPLYRVALKDVKPMKAQMRLATYEDRTLLEQWYAGYAHDTGLTSSEAEAKHEGADRAQRAVGNPDVMLLCDDARPVAMAGINARVADMVQIGGVYTPPASRGRGLARRAVVGLLSHQKNMTHSILFAADAAAARAYEAIGYSQIGSYRVAMLRTPQTLGAVT